MDVADKSMPVDDSRVLMVVLATSLWAFLPMTGVVAQAEAILIGWTVGFLVGYWLPPRPKVGFVRWTSERILFIAVFYAVVLKLPPIIAPSTNEYLRYGVAFLLFLALYFVWTRQPKSTLRRGRA
jgi:hypothetical protein